VKKAEATGDDALDQEDSESFSSLSRFSIGAYNHPLQRETMSDDEDNSHIIADFDSETSIDLDTSIANQWTAAVIRDLMKPLTAGELDQINSALTPTGNSNDIMITITMGKDLLQRQSICHLNPGIWLNDEVMNLVNKHITSQTFARLCKAVTGRKPSYVMSTFFLQSLCDLKNKDHTLRRKVNYQNVKNWARKVKVVDGDLFQLAFLHFPFNVDDVHWTLVSVSFDDKLIVYYDSMHGEDPVVAYAVYEYLMHHNIEKHGEKFDIDNWRVILKPTGDEFTTHYSSYPMQENGELFCPVSLYYHSLITSHILLIRL
jgi:Ulp1 family protease